MQLRQDFHYVNANGLSPSCRYLKCHFSIIQHQALHKGHHIEVSAIHSWVRAEPISGGNRHGRILQGMDDSMFPPHVMSGLKHMTQWGAPQHISVTRRIFAAIGQVGMAPNDQ